jgi:N-formylmaleamate deformylase
MTAPPRQGRHIIANSVRLHFVRVGEGRPPLVLLPGITSPAVTWEFVAAGLAAHNDVYVLDNRGRGLSQGGPELGYRLDDYAADAEALISALGLKRPAILGHSMGARIAVRLAARAPTVVGKIVLVDPPVSGPGRRSYPIPLNYYLESIQAVSRGAGYEEMKKSLPWSDEHLQLRMEWLPTCDPTAVSESHKSFQDEDIHADLPKIEAETLLMYAEKGGTVSEADAEVFVAALRSGHKQRIDGAGHMIPWDQYDLFIGAVHAFLLTDDRSGDRG